MAVVADQPSSSPKVVVKRCLLLLADDGKGDGAVFLPHPLLKGGGSRGTDPLKGEGEGGGGDSPSPPRWEIRLEDSDGAGALLLFEAEDDSGVSSPPPPPPPRGLTLSVKEEFGSCYLSHAL
jgi:hypothetical protein